MAQRFRNIRQLMVAIADGLNIRPLLPSQPRTIDADDQVGRRAAHVQERAVRVDSDAPCVGAADV
jgi:hypothetical protein